MSTSKADHEIIEIATNVLGNLVDEISDAQYSKLSGSLRIGWSIKKVFNACVYSVVSSTGGPEHYIEINYELVIQLYRYAERFYVFTQDERLHKFLNNFPADYTSFPLLPHDTTKSSCINNMFMASLTWVLFHELGHAVQEHGVIRKKYCCNAGADGLADNKSSQVYTEELNVQGEKDLSRHCSLIYHVTELAADYEATNISLSEIFRHARQFAPENANLQWEQVLDMCYLMIASMAYTFYRFNGGRMIPQEAAPTGTHPNAIFRMEMVVRQICQLLRLQAVKSEYVITDRHILILSKQAADLGAIFWYFAHSDKSVDIVDLVIKGLSERPEFRSYAKELITTWDNVLPEILEIRYFGSQFGILHFDNEYRQYAFGYEPS